MHLTKNNLNVLLSLTADALKAQSNEHLFKSQGAAFEPLLVGALTLIIEQQCITNVIQVELVSGHRFPDIVIHTHSEKLGIEVKTSKSQGWSTLGGSIFESTRVKDVECIYLFFVNFSNPSEIQYRYKPIEACISDVVITHKPRYAINLDVEQSFFDKANISYQQLQQAKNPFGLIRQYMKNKAGANAELWWISDDESADFDVKQLGPQAIRHFSSLNKVEKENLVIELYALFPEVLSSSTQKYEKLALYLVAKKGIVHTSLRDTFSAGGKFAFDNDELPKYFKRILEKQSLSQIRQAILGIAPELIEEYWEVDDIDNRIKIWLEKVNQQIQSNDKLSCNIKPKLINRITVGIEHH
ncbi:hypothetical protein SOPP22_19240 [Shewanella sp. OPT22]|nr:hypothetical protein SOPP22_19240 [Shewanella sp. OPT22]